VVPLSRSDFDLRVYADVRRASMSGMQVKIGVVLEEGMLKPQAVGSQFILKPAIADLKQSAIYEHLSMKISEKLLKGKLAECALIKLQDGNLAYLTKRFDRGNKKHHFEDLSQILNLDQFDGTYEEVCTAIQKHSNTFSVVEFLHALLIQFYIGNDDFHLKNIALIDIQKNSTYKRLSPLYDCINTESLLRNMPGHSYEMAIDFFRDYESEIYLRDGHSSYQTFAYLYELAGVSTKLLDSHLSKLNKGHHVILEMIEKSLLSNDDKKDFQGVLIDRLNKLNKKK